MKNYLLQYVLKKKTIYYNTDKVHILFRKYVKHLKSLSMQSNQQEKNVN